MIKNDDTTTRILIDYDGSGYSHAILNELRSSGLPQKAEVIIISVAETWLPVEYLEDKNFPDSDVAEYVQKHREQVDRNLAETKVIVREAREELLRYFPDWNIRTEIYAGSPAREILSRSSEFNPDLVVVGAQGLSSDLETGLGSISQKVLTDAKCSVRVSRSKPDVSRYRLKIIIGFDASKGSMAAVRTVALRSWKTKPEIRLVTITDPFILLKPGRVLQPILGLSEGRMKGQQELVKMLAANAIQVLDDAGLSVTLHTYDGNPRMVMVREAEKWGADSVFMGATSLQVEPEFYPLGCVASAIAALANCSVEVVRIGNNHSCRLTGFTNEIDVLP